MKFVIEALGLTASGGKTGLLRLLPSLARQRGNRFVVLLADVAEFRALAEALEGPTLKLVFQKKPASLLRRHFYLQRAVPQVCAAEQADALLCLGNFGPQQPTVPTVVFLHNAHYVWSSRAPGAKTTLRERCITWYGRHYLRRLPEGVWLVVQTEFMKQRAMAAHGVPATRVVVIGDGDGLPPEAQRASAKQQGFRAASFREPFTFLSVAHYYPHKNLEVLAEAMKRLPAYTARPARSVLTIHPDHHPGARRLLRKIATEDLGQAVVNVGPVTGEKVSEVYRSANAFILPTLLESFGRTYIEAMRFHLPILTSDRQFARHVCREAALYFDPLDPESIARCMARIMEDEGLAIRLAVAGQCVLAQVPTWDEIAAQFVGLLERAADGRGFERAEPVPLTNLC